MTRALDRRQLLGIAAASGSMLLLPRPVLAGPAVAPPPAQRTIYVSNAAMLSSALANALPGDHIVLNNGSYQGQFKLERSGTASAPIVVRAASTLGASIYGNIHLLGSFSQLWRVRIQDGSLFIYGNSAKVMRCRFDRGPAAAGTITCLLMSGTDAEISGNEFFGIRQRGISMRLAYGVRRPRITYNYFKDFQGVVGTNVHEPIQLGYGTNDSYISLGAIVAYNLIDRCAVDDEAISIKSSDNFIAYNTIINSARSAIHVRRGARNQLIGNWTENAGGIRVMDLANVVVSNRVLGDALAAIEVFAGNAQAGTKSADVAYPAAKYTKLSGNMGKIIVGRAYSSASPKMNIPATNTLIEAHSGQIIYNLHTGTRITSSTSIALSSPRKLDSSEVGVYG